MVNNILNKRRNGILMPIFSLNSPYGIGTLGKAAYNFVDWLSSQGQTYWQILPVHPTTLDNSPYTAFSAMAGNELFIDIDTLISENYLSKEDISKIDYGQDKNNIDYIKVRSSRNILFEKAYNNFLQDKPSDYYSFCELNQSWLDDYALFIAIKKHLKMEELENWPHEYKFKDRKTINYFLQNHLSLVNYYKFLQYLFFKQWNALREYAKKNNVYIIGDIPFYIAHDSADLWANPEVFVLNKNLEPTIVAGCPPDAFSEDGQLWGNPIYNWKQQKRAKYNWWIRRLAHSFQLYDVLRIDHFRGFESYYTIDARADTAKQGIWEKGPGIDFFKAIETSLGKKPIIAEDLGYITDDVKQLLNNCGYPGMKILQFAFDSREPDTSYLPYYYEKNSIVHTGNHDNDTLAGWMNTALREDIELAMKYFGLEPEREAHKLPQAMIFSAMGSVSNTCILCIQDLLELGSEARINIPATTKTNWKWRLTSEQITKLKKYPLLQTTEMFGRIN